MTTTIYLLIFLWLSTCMWQDLRTRKVSNWLTLPPIPMALMARLTGWTDTPWLLTFIVIVAATCLWWVGGLGGADLKGWITFSLLGVEIMLSAALGMLLWFALIRLYRYLHGQFTEEHIPGFPGYWLGVVMWGITLISANEFFIGLNFRACANIL